MKQKKNKAVVKKSAPVKAKRKYRKRRKNGKAKVKTQNENSPQNLKRVARILTAVITGKPSLLAQAFDLGMEQGFLMMQMRKK